MGTAQKYFMPQELLEHAAELLKKEMFIVNQGEQEAEIQQKLLDRAGLQYKFLGEIKAALNFLKIRVTGF